MTDSTESSDQYCARELRQQDSDRWLTTLLAPDRHRPALVALYAFNAEIARAREAVSQPMIGQIRLQWWREAWQGIAAGTPRQHPVVLALHAHCRGIAGWADLQMLIDARERDMDPAPIADMDELCRYAESISAPLMRLAAGLLGVPVDDGLRRVTDRAGAASALAGLLRSIPFFAAQQRVYLPADRLAARGLPPEAIYQQGIEAAAREVVAEVAGRAEELLAGAAQTKLDRSLLPALLPAALARPYLRSLRRAGHDPFSPAAAVSPTARHLALLLARWRRRL